MSHENAASSTPFTGPRAQVTRKRGKATRERPTMFEIRYLRGRVAILNNQVAEQAQELHRLAKAMESKRQTFDSMEYAQAGIQFLRRGDKELARRAFADASRHALSY